MCVCVCAFVTEVTDTHYSCCADYGSDFNINTDRTSWTECVTVWATYNLSHFDLPSVPMEITFVSAQLHL